MAQEEQRQGEASKVSEVLSVSGSQDLNSGPDSSPKLSTTCYSAFLLLLSFFVFPKLDNSSLFSYIPSLEDASEILMKGLQMDSRAGASCDLRIKQK